MERCSAELAGRLVTTTAAPHTWNKLQKGDLRTGWKQLPVKNPISFSLSALEQCVCSMAVMSQTSSVPSSILLFSSPWLFALAVVIPWFSRPWNHPPPSSINRKQILAASEHIYFYTKSIKSWLFKADITESGYVNNTILSLLMFTFLFNKHEQFFPCGSECLI